jgi:hypothetical protein
MCYNEHFSEYDNFWLCDSQAHNLLISVVYLYLQRHSYHVEQKYSGV